MKKRLLLLLLAVVMCFTITGCDVEDIIEGDTKKEGIVPVMIFENFKVDHGVLNVTLGDLETKGLFVFNPIDQPVNASEFGFSSKSGNLLTFYVENGELRITYEADNYTFEQIKDLTYTPVADRPLTDKNGKVLTEFSVDQIPYTDNKFFSN